MIHTCICIYKIYISKTHILVFVSTHQPDMFEGSGPRLRFELLRSRPREAFDRLTSFLGSHRDRTWPMGNPWEIHIENPWKHRDLKGTSWQMELNFEDFAPGRV